MLNCTPIEYCMGNISGLSDSELLQVATAIKREQNARENKKKQELVTKVVTALTELYTVCDDSITIVCNNCDHKTSLDLDVLAEMIDFQIG